MSVLIDLGDVTPGRRVRGSLGPWRSVGATRPGGGVVATRVAPATGRVWYGLLDPARLSARLLGVAEGVDGDCQTTPDVLVCRRPDASVGI